MLRITTICIWPNEKPKSRTFWSPSEKNFRLSVFLHRLTWGDDMWIKSKNDFTILFCVLQPRASRSEIVGLHGSPPRLKIRIAAPPVDGEANEELIRFLSKTLHIAKSQFEIHSGHTGKFKEVHVRNSKSTLIQQQIESVFKK